MELSMKYFELRFLDSRDFLIAVRPYEGADDLSALEEAERRAQTHTIEVWEGQRHVARVNKGNAPLQAGDLHGG
jgi:hypothetical protein